MKEVILSLIIIFSFQGCIEQGSSESNDGRQMNEWKPLFNGKDLTGWEVVGAGNWHVEDGNLHVTRNEGETGGGWLVTKQDFADFKLRLKVKMNTKGNSGILIRDPGHAKIYRPAFNGYEVQVYEGGAVYEREGDENDMRNTNGAIYDFARSYYKELITGEWNQFEVHCVGNHIVTYMNGEKMAEIYDRRSYKGAIGLQLHGGRDKAHFSWKDVEIMELPQKEKPSWQLMEEAVEQAPGEYVDFLADKSMDDFDVYWDGGAEWTLTDGILRGENPEEISWIFTAQEYSNYILSFDVRISKGGNAGVGLRFPWEQAEERKIGPATLGYEVQIIDDHSYDLKNPSGSIYNIARAYPSDLWRKPIFRSEQWNSFKIYVRGDHIVTYVNNRKTGEAHVKREPRGRIGFQVHSPAKWIKYRNVRIKEL